MTNPRMLPHAGYIIEKVYTTTQSLTVKHPGGQPDQLPPDLAIYFIWDWYLLPEVPGMFEVQLTFGYDPTPLRLEQARVTITGRFSTEPGGQSVEFDTFVQFHAPALLMPFLREAVSTMTARGYYGAYYLPPINIPAWMATQDPTQTRGARQRAAQVAPGAPVPSSDIASTPEAVQQPPAVRAARTRKRRTAQAPE